MFLVVLQGPPTDPAFYQAWEQLGPQAILVAVLFGGSFLFWRLLKRAWEATDRLDTENTTLTRQNELMAREGMTTIRDFTGRLRELEREMAALKLELVRRDP